MKPSIAVLLAVYAATSGIGASVALEVTFTITPDRRARNCGSTAWIIAIEPNVLVSNISRTVAIGVVSKAPNAADAGVVDEHVDRAGGLERGRDAVGVGDVEREHAQPTGAGRTSSRGVRMVAMTFQPCAWKWRAVARP